MKITEYGRTYVNLEGRLCFAGFKVEAGTEDYPLKDGQLDHGSEEFLSDFMTEVIVDAIKNGGRLRGQVG